MAKVPQKKIQKHKCKFCNKEFAKEATINTHPCMYRDRFNARESKVFIQAYTMYMNYHQYQNLSISKTVEPIMHFIKSSFFNDFIKFSEYVINNYIVEKDKFIETILRGNTPIKSWDSLNTYTSWVKTISKEENISIAIARSIESLVEWQTITGNDWTTFFSGVSSERFKFWLETGKISPWFVNIQPLEVQNKILSRFPTSELEYINQYLDRTYFSMLMVRHSAEVNELRELMTIYNF